jgi:hypothetical protein
MPKLWQGMTIKSAVIAWGMFRLDVSIQSVGASNRVASPLYFSV